MAKTKSQFSKGKGDSEKKGGVPGKERLQVQDPRCRRGGSEGWWCVAVRVHRSADP